MPGSLTEKPAAAGKPKHDICLSPYERVIMERIKLAAEEVARQEELEMSLRVPIFDRMWDFVKACMILCMGLLLVALMVLD